MFAIFRFQKFETGSVNHADSGDIKSLFQFKILFPRKFDVDFLSIFEIALIVPKCVDVEKSFFNRKISKF